MLEDLAKNEKISVIGLKGIEAVMEVLDGIDEDGWKDYENKLIESRKKQ